MPRPVKCRKVCHFPKVLEFLPAHAEVQRPPVLLTVDEYETIRLIDKEGFSQEACGEWMQVARTTVQKIYDSARKSWQKRWWRGLRSTSRAASSSSAMEKAPAGDVWTALSGGTTSNMKNKKETKL